MAELAFRHAHCHFVQKHKDRELLFDRFRELEGDPPDKLITRETSHTWELFGTCVINGSIAVIGDREYIKLPV
jgi:hypothetical protein